MSHDVLQQQAVWHGVMENPLRHDTLLVLGRSAVRNHEWPWIRADGVAPRNGQGWCYASALAVVLERARTQPPKMVVLCAIQDWTADEVLHARRTIALSSATVPIQVGLQGDLMALGRGECGCAQSLQAIGAVPRSPMTPDVVPTHSHHVATLQEAHDWMYQNRPKSVNDVLVVVVTLEPEMAVKHHAGGLSDLRKPGRWVFVGPKHRLHKVVQTPVNTAAAAPPLGFLTCQKFCHSTPHVVPRCNAQQATYVTPSQFQKHLGWVHGAIMLVDVPLAVQCRVAARCRHAVCTVRCRKLSNDRLPFAFSSTGASV